MPKKLKFKPVITRVKLNPEQAVLQCYGFIRGWYLDPDSSDIGDACDGREYLGPNIFAVVEPTQS